MLEYYVGFVLIVTVHELGHTLLLLIFRVKITRVTIGNFLHLKIGRVWFSPLVLSGSTMFSKTDFENISIIPRLLILLAGPSANAALGVFLFPAHFILGSVSFFAAIVTLLPIPFAGTDGWNIVMEGYKFFAGKRSNR